MKTKIKSLWVGRFSKKFYLGLIVFTLSSTNSLIYAAASETTKDEGGGFGVEAFLIEIIKKTGAWGLAFIIIVISFLLAKIVKASVIRIVASRYDELHRDLISFCGRLGYFTTVTLGFLISFNTIGIDITTILGGLMVGVGLAMRDILSNFTAGAMILFSRQISSGQSVKMEGEFIGKIEDIKARNTIIRGFDGTMTIVPNVKFLTKTITNFSANDFRRHEFLVGVSYDDDLKKASEVIRASLQRHSELVPELAPQVVVSNFADSSIEFTVRFWLESKAPFPNITSKIMIQLKNDLDTAGISIPWPIRTIKIDKDEPLATSVPKNTAVNIPRERPQSSGEIPVG